MTTAAAPMAMPAIATPTPIPACAPVDRPLDCPEDELVDVDDGEDDVEEPLASPEAVAVDVDEVVLASRPTVVAARWETSKDQLSLFAPLPDGADELGLRSNQQGVSEPDQSSLIVAVLL